MHVPSPGIDAATAAILLLDVTVAYFLKGISGFGPALVFMPVASLVCDPHVALVTSAVIDLIVGIVLARTLKYTSDEIRLAGKLVVGVGAGTVAGASVAGALPSEALLVLVAVTVLGVGCHLALRAGHAPAAAVGGPRIYAGCIAGGASGGLVGISGPFVVAGVSRLEKGAFRRVLVMVFLAEGVLKLGVYCVAGVWTASAIPLALLVSPGVVLGLALGLRTHVHLPERRFKQTVGAILTAMGIVALVAALG